MNSDLLVRSSRTPVAQRCVQGGSLLLVAMLSACGGSDNGCGFDPYGNPLPCYAGVAVGPAPVPVPVASASAFLIDQALINSALQVQNYNIAGSDQFGNTYALNLMSQPGPATSFNGLPAISANITQTLYQNGVLVSSQQFTNFYTPTGDQLMGSAGPAVGSFEVVTSAAPVPVSGIVGQSFPSLTANLFRDTSQTVLDGTLAETLSLAPDTASTALLCTNDTVQLTANGIADGLGASQSTTCLRISPSGGLLGLTMSFVNNGVLLNLQ